MRRSATSEVGSDAISERLIKEVVALRADLKQGLAALTDPQGRLAERAALEELRVDSGAEFRSAYQVTLRVLANFQPVLRSQEGMCKF